MTREIVVEGPRTWVRDIQLGDGINHSGTITLNLAPGQGDCFVKGGTVDVDAWTATGGFIIGVDDTDSDLAKLFVGSTASSFINWNGVALAIQIGSGHALTVKGGGNIALEAGGDITLTPSDADPSLIKWSTTYNMGAAVVVAARGLNIWPTVGGTGEFGIGRATDGTVTRFNKIHIYGKVNVTLNAYTDATHYAIMGPESAAGIGLIAMIARDGATEYRLTFDGGTPRLGPYDQSNVIDLASSSFPFKDGWFGGKISSGTAVHSAVGPTDDVDVSGINTLFVNTAANNVTIGGFAGGVDGQYLFVVRISAANNVTIEHNEPGATQPILLHAGADETLDAHYGGWIFICHGGADWHDASHAKHV